MPVFLRAEEGADAFREAAGDLKEGVLPGCLIEGGGCLGEMAEAVQLVEAAEVSEAPVRVGERVIGVEIAVVLLGCFDEGHRLVYEGLELRIGVLGQGEGGRLDPLIDVGVLEGETEEAAGGVLALFRPGLEAPLLRRDSFSHAATAYHPGGLAEVVEAVARLGAGHAVVDRLPLIRENLLSNQLKLLLPEAAGECKLCEFQGG